MTLQIDWRQVGRTVRGYSTTFYLGSLGFEPSRRRAVWGVYLACRYGDDSVDELGGGRESLANWWAGIESVYAGEPGQQLWQQALSYAVGFGVPKQAFTDMRAGFLRDLSLSQIADTQDLLTYCYQVAGTVSLMISPIAGVPQSVYPNAIALGQAMQITNCLRDVREDLERGRVYLPQELLAKHRLTGTDLMGPGSPASRAVLAELVALAESLYGQGFAALDQIKRGRLGIQLAALQYRALWAKVVASDWPSPEPRIRLTTWERLALMPQALRGSR